MKKVLKGLAKDALVAEFLPLRISEGQSGWVIT